MLIERKQYMQTLDKSPNLSKLESLGNYITEGGVPEYYNQKEISQSKEMFRLRAT